MIIKVIQDRGEDDKGFAIYCYEADSYICVNERDPKKQCVSIFKDGKQIQCFENPIFKEFYICNNNGKTIDTIEFR